MRNRQLAEELHKSISRILEKLKVYSSFENNIWRASIAYMQLTSKWNKRVRFLLRVINIFSNYAWVVPLKYKKSITIANAFQKNLDKSNCKPNKIWLDKGSELCSRSMKSWLQDNDIETYLRQNLKLLSLKNL